MPLDELRTLIKAQPFQPFVNRLADDRQIPVQHRDFILVAPHGRTAVVYQPDNSFNIIDVLLVTDLEVQPGAGRDDRAAG